MHRHLRGGVQGNPGAAFPDQFRGGKILHDHRVRTGFRDGGGLRFEQWQLVIHDERIERDVDRDVSGMAEGDRLRKAFLLKIFGVPARVEVFCAEIDRIRAAANGRKQLLPAARRSENLRHGSASFPKLHAYHTTPPPRKKACDFCRRDEIFFGLW